MSRPSRSWLVFGLKSCLFFLCLTALLTFTAGSASAYTQTLSVGPGILSYSVSQTNGTCYNGGPTSYTQWNFSGFVFTPSGGSGQSLGGSAIYFQSPGGSNCPPNGAQPSPLVLSGSGYNINFYASSGGGSATYQASLTYTVYPAYKVLNVAYIPPGNNSYVGYTTTVTNGTTTKIDHSFSAGGGGGLSVTFTGVLGTDPMVDPTIGASGEVNFGLTNTTGDSSSFTENISSSTNVKYQSSSDALDHTKDQIYIWLNPAVIMTQTGSNSVSYTLGVPANNYGTDPKHTPVMDVYNASVAQLQNPKLMAVGQLISQTVDGVSLPGLLCLCANAIPVSQCTQAQVGQNGCGCTANDFADIVKQDPFFLPNAPQNATPAQINQILPNRFAYINTQLLDFGVQSTYTVDDKKTTETTYSTMSDNSVSWTRGFSFSPPVGWGIGWKDNLKFTWSDSMETTKTNSLDHIMTAFLTSTVPVCYSNVDIYQDTVYHTYVFVMDSAAPSSCP